MPNATSTTEIAEPFDQLFAQLFEARLAELVSQIVKRLADFESQMVKEMDKIASRLDTIIVDIDSAGKKVDELSRTV